MVTSYINRYTLENRYRKGNRKGYIHIQHKTNVTKSTTDTTMWHRLHFKLVLIKSITKKDFKKKWKHKTRWKNYTTQFADILEMFQRK